jgi:hypothetical protein
MPDRSSAPVREWRNSQTGFEAMSTIRIARFATLLAVAIALTVTGAVAGAAGEALILGETNAAGAHQTHLTANLSAAVLKLSQNGNGSPLSLKGSTTKPPMVVNSRQRVLNLNADLIDGRSAGAFLPSASYRQASGEVIVPASAAEAFTVSCDAGDLAMSGGFSGISTTTRVLDSYPLTDEGWHFRFRNQGTTSDTVFAYAVCADFAPRHGATLGTDDSPRD